MKNHAIPNVVVAVTLAAALASPGAGNLGAQSARDKVRSGATTAAISARPLASHPQGQQMMAEAAQKAALLDINFKFLNKTYENDQYVRDPITKTRIRTACLRFKASSGFRFRMDVPKFTLTNTGLTVEQNFSKISADGLTVKVQVGPCADIAAGVGIRLSNVKAVYKARPMLSFDQNNYCKLNWNLDSDDMRISIGDLNIIGVQNNIDKLAKDAVREALNAVLEAVFSGTLRSELAKISINVCGNATVKTR